MSQKIVAANWKMNPMTLKEAEKIFSGIAKSISGIKKTKIVVAAPFIYLEKLKKISQKIFLAGENCSFEEKGAFTGEISAEMLYGIGARYVILGHSERRGGVVGAPETNEEVNRKIKAALFAGLLPIVCVGEKERDESHEYLDFIISQVEESLAGLKKESLSRIILAYEPVWAIGKTAKREATPEEFQEMKILLKKTLSDKFGIQAALKVKIIYGGSVNPKNALGFIKEGEADGFLVGRDSLDAKKFGEIVKICEA